MHEPTRSESISLAPSAGLAPPAAVSGATSEWPLVSRLWSGTFGGRNAMTCDVEDYFQVSAFEGLVARPDWDRLECRVPRNVDIALDLFAATGAKCTFFVLGWVAERFPHVVRRLADAGHELASHGMDHTRVWAQTPAEFRRDVTRAKRLIEEAGGQPVRGYRAASWSMDKRTPWAHEVLREAGYEYSSSIYPIAHDHYGAPRAPAQPFFVRPADLLEIPATTARLLGRNWPAAGGGYFRLFPLPVSRWLLQRAGATNGGAVFYFHPWELDPGQPRMEGISRRTRFRHYLNLDKFESRLGALLKSFRWGRMDEIFLAAP